MNSRAGSAADAAVDAKRFKRVLVANRGEIAVRIIRACRDLGIETVQVYSDADRDSLPVRLADRAVCIGPARSGESYLNARFIVSAALVHGADAIHPGYGFLSENAGFAALCEQEGVTFIGPSARVISLMGDKAMARRMADEAGVPTTPGSRGTVASAAEARAIAVELGYPVLLKAAAGGGGRGMRVVREPAELDLQFGDAAREAKAAFGDGSIYVEKFLSRVRHIEIQILSDGETVLHLGERDCSAQRRNQKLLEESPSPALGEALRAEIGAAAVRLCRHVGYRSAGTIECILDPETQRFYFMEMNTRVQVEHPVTECVTGIDIVKEQIRVAQGEALGIAQRDIEVRGHAIECRINAEDPARNFAPCPGTVHGFHAPGGPGVRVDSHLFSGYRIPPYYDSLLAKLIVWGRSRDEAIARMRRALGEMRVEGVTTTIPFHLSLLDDPHFVRGEIHTRFVEERLLETR
ncbi:Biotin carboxylase of acetyl-CoA carboxylase [Caballeronia glathei]|jgi:acetyl-CoA carboxylase biotin carboxylase subunit|uniref:Biotin carboxylase n=1 Tax=Caballeronia glathei TaxID=60547 RepID=A0A069PIB6_9BURK|nr:acetyl-CoA carboxylase biotin carboxylase subunit [Caballeronia glathei]KDR40478.1 acetyl-CoA carboxylase [Caballeronia glathei]CDY77033.1 Biotin carboxylase of acetyl-CoA carboxylase [Caballeronia glathei]